MILQRRLKQVESILRCEGLLYCHCKRETLMMQILTLIQLGYDCYNVVGVAEHERQMNKGINLQEESVTNVRQCLTLL
jgi:hypothetical protein